MAARRDSATCVTLLTAYLLIQGVDSSPFGFLPNPAKVLDDGAKRLEGGAGMVAHGVDNVLDTFSRHRGGGRGFGIDAGVGGENVGFGDGGFGANINVGGVGIGGDIGLGRGGLGTGLHLGGHGRGRGSTDLGLGGGGLNAGVGLGDGGLNVGLGLGDGGLNPGVGLGDGGLNAGVGLGDGGLNVGLGLGDGGLNAGVGLGDGGLNAGVDLGLGGDDIKAGVDIGGTGAGFGLSMGTTESLVGTGNAVTTVASDEGLTLGSVGGRLNAGTLTETTDSTGIKITTDYIGIETSADDIGIKTTADYIGMSEPDELPLPVTEPSIPEVTIQASEAPSGDEVITTSFEDLLVAITQPAPLVTTDTLGDHIVPATWPTTDSGTTLLNPVDLETMATPDITTESEYIDSIALLVTDSTIGGDAFDPILGTDTTLEIITTTDDISSDVVYEATTEIFPEKDASFVSTEVNTDVTPGFDENIIIGGELATTTEEMEYNIDYEEENTTEDDFSTTTEAYSTTDFANVVIIPGFNDDTSASESDDESGSGIGLYDTVTTTIRAPTKTPTTGVRVVPIHGDTDNERGFTTATPVDVYHRPRTVAPTTATTSTTSRYVHGVPPINGTNGVTGSGSHSGGRVSNREDLDVSRVLLVIFLWLGFVIILFLLIIHYEKFLILWEYRCVCGVSKGCGKDSTVLQETYQSHYDIDL